MLKRIFFTLLLLLAIVSSGRFSHAHDSDVDLEDHVLRIETDDSHDIVVVRVNPEDADEFEVLILQFDDPVSLFDFNSEEALFDAADDFRDEYENIEDVDSIEVYTLGGNDVIIMDTGSLIPCKLVGGDDDDYIVGSHAADEIYGDGENPAGPESGDDEINANSGDDLVRGGPGDDDINGGLGNDTLHGDAGEDFVRGWSGDDTIYGGTEDDDLYGNSDNDEMYGGPGEDDMYGGSGDDEMYGGNGDDDMDGGSGDDEMWGEANHDIMFGDTGDDDLYGGNGDDELYGEAGRDALFGGANNDLLDGSYDGEVDAMEGGSGADEFIHRYFEYRSVTIMTWQTVRQPRWTWVNGFPVLRWINVRIRVPRTITFRSTLETESVVDNNLAEGDELTAVEIE